MKTAEEWAAYVDSRILDHPEADMRSIMAVCIREVQRDALLHAAKIASHAGNYSSDMPGLYLAKQAILAEAKKLKP